MVWYNIDMSETKLPVTVIIIARDEASNLRFLLPQLFWAEQVWVIGNHCSDESEKVTRENDACWLVSESDDFAVIRSEFLSQIQTKWLFYLDADERVNGRLLKELREKLSLESSISAWQLQREDYHYGVKMTAGGWQNDRVVRIFQTKMIRGWHGSIHESPDFEGELGEMKASLLHLTHRDTASNLAKSSRWTIKEAQLYVMAGEQQVSAWTICRKAGMEFYRRYCRDGGYRDGMAGFVEAFVQACNRAFVYIQIWELQQQPSIAQKYANLEKIINQSLKC